MVSGTVTSRGATPISLLENYRDELLDKHVLASLRPVCLGLAPLYTLFAAGHFFLLESALEPLLDRVAVLFCVAVSSSLSTARVV